MRTKRRRKPKTKGEVQPQTPTQKTIDKRKFDEKISQLPSTINYASERLIKGYELIGQGIRETGGRDVDRYKSYEAMVTDVISKKAATTILKRVFNNNGYEAFEKFLQTNFSLIKEDGTPHK